MMFPSFLPGSITHSRSTRW